MRKKELFQLAGQLMLSVFAVLLGGVPMAMASGIQAGEGVHVDNVPEAEVTNPTVTDGETEGGGKAVFPEQSVTTVTESGAGAEVYEPQYDKLITQVRIARTPLDQISRRGRSQRVKAMEFKYATIDYLPITTKVKTALSATGTPSESNEVKTLEVVNAKIFNRRDVVIVKGVTGGDGTDLKLWVLDRDKNTNIDVMAINGTPSGNYTNLIPAIAKDTDLVRIAKACAELDSQAPGYAIFPTTSEQYCQKFMAQVEQSTIDALTAKRFDINLSDQEEATLADMRLGMEGAFLFGSKNKVLDPDTQRYAWMTGGIWNQVTEVQNYTKGSLAVSTLIDWTKDAFTGPAAGKSNKRVVMCGSDLLNEIQKLFVAEQTIVNTFKKWDLEFVEFTTTFGSFEFILNEVFDLHGMADCGMILDVDYLQRYTFEPFGRNTLDLNAQGTRDSKAIVLREISALVLKSPNNHAKIIPNA